MSSEERGQNKQDDASNGVPGFGAFFWRRLFVVLTASLVLGLLFRFLSQIFGWPGQAFLGIPSTIVSLLVIFHFAPTTMRDTGLMICVAMVTGALTMLVYAAFLAYFDSNLGFLLGAGLASGFGALMVLLAFRLLSKAGWQITLNGQT